MVLPFLHWVGEQRPELRRPEQLDVQLLREYRAQLTSRPTRTGRPLRPDTILDSHRALMTFFRTRPASDTIMPKSLATAAVDRFFHYAHMVLADGPSIRLEEETAGKGVMPLA